MTDGAPAAGGSARSVLRCPHCGGESEEWMPDDACVFFHPCAHCGVLLRPLQGHCCVFCSYGSEPCPPKRDEECCGSEQVER